jgi:hypothetical protein
MKKLFYVCLAISIIFAACKKEDEAPATVSIIGNWNCFEWDIIYNIGYWTAYPNGQRITTHTHTEVDNFWLDLFFYSDGTVIGIDEDGWTAAGDWIKNGNSLIIDENNFTISTLSASSLIVYSTEEDTSTVYWNPSNDTIYFTEQIETIKWERNNSSN